MPGWMEELSVLINTLLGTSLQTGRREALRNHRQPRCAFLCTDNTSDHFKL